MHLKKCAGCARAIVETAAVCQYCGHVVMDPGASQPDLGFDADDRQMTFEGQFTQDEQPLHELVDANEEPVQAEHPEPEPTHAGLQEPGERVPAASAFDETLIENAAGEPLPDDRVFDRLQEEKAGRKDGMAVPLEDQFAFFRDDEDPAADYTIEEVPTPAPAPAEQRQPAARAAAPAAPAGPARKPQVRTLAMGAAAAVILILGILSMRGAASPGATAAVPAALPKPKAAPAAKPAAAPVKAQAAVTQPAVTQPVKTQAAAPSAHSALVSAPSWSRVTDGRWVGRDRRAIALELEAIGKVPVWMRQVRPVLVVRCTSGAAEVFVYTQTAAMMEPQDENHTVRVRVDDGQDMTQRWADSLEHDALFAPDGSALAQQLMQARTLRFGFTPHNAAPVVAEFDVTGLAGLLAPSARQCGWKK